MGDDADPGSETATLAEGGSEEFLEVDLDTTTVARDPAPPPMPMPMSRERSDRLAHFALRRPIGRGGMGVVYAAHDERLDRPVALKVLRTDRASPRERVRLLGEAQALARLTHPNVVTIYEVGEVDGQIFLAMELVKGVTLDAWLKKEARSLAAILKVFAEAGRGLQAAHAAGLVHRDFKPGNVIVGDDGRVRVLDFGIAFAAVDAEAAPRPPSPFRAAELRATAPSLAAIESQRTESEAIPALAEITVGHSIAGTPPYMPLEQIRGQDVDARSDVYAFTVSLYEAVYGARPTRARTLAERLVELRDALRAPKPLALPARPRIPRWLAKAIRRGLALAAEDRHASMAELLVAIDHGRHRRRRVLAIGALGGVLLTSGAYGVAWQQATEPCSGGEAAIASAWGEDARRELAAAFEAAPFGHAGPTWSRLGPRLDTYAEGWVSARRSACEAHLRGERSSDLYDRQLACLDRRKAALEALRRALRDLDEAAVSGALRAVGALPSIDGCADIPALTAASPPPSDPAVAAEVQAIERLIAEANADRNFGRLDEAAERADEALARAREVAYLPILARATGTRGAVAYAREAGDDPLPLVTEAMWLADTIRDDALLADMMAIVMITLAYSDRPAEARALRRHAEAVIQRLGEGTPGHARLLGGFATIELVEGNEDAAIAALSQVLEIEEASEPRDVGDVAQAHNNVALAYGQRGGEGDLDRAREHLQLALEQKESIYGPEHPELADTLTNLGVTEIRARRAAEGCPYLERALEIDVGSVGEGHPSTLNTAFNLGSCLFASERDDEAVAIMAWATKTAIKVHGLSSRVAIRHLSNLASARASIGEFGPTIEALEPAIVALRGEGEGRERELAELLFAVGEAAYEGGDDALASARLEEAVRLYGGIDEPFARMQGAQAGFLLAKALTRQGRDAARSRRLAEAALADLQALEPEGFAKTIAEIEAWLAAHGGKRGKAKRSKRAKKKSAQKKSAKKKSTKTK